MFGALNLQFSNPPISTNCKRHRFSVAIEPRRLQDLNKPVRRFASLSTQVEYNATAPSAPSISSHYTSTVGSSSASSLQLTQWNFNHRHILMLQVVTCAAFKRAAESLEKLMDVTREELPDTMAAVRLSGMEISDLTMELSDLGQEITQGVKSSTRAVHLAEERLRRLTNMASSGGRQPQN